MESIQAIYEGGVFRPVTPVRLPEHSVVVFEPRVVTPQDELPNQDAIERLLSLRFNSGDPEGAARHNQHQP